MRLIHLAALPLLACALAACESEAEKQAEATEEAIERQADASADALSAKGALGLTVRQLLDADLVAADGADLGDIEQVRWGADGEVESLLVEIENTEPDRYVAVPLAGLSTRKSGDDTDLQTTMTAAELSALPDAQLDAAAAGAAPAATATTS